MSRKRKNAGQGFGFMFHGAFSKKSDAVAKEQKTPGSFIKFAMTKHGARFVVMSPRKNPMRPRGTKKDERTGRKTVSYRTTKNLEFGEYEKGEFHPWTRLPRSRKRRAVRKLAKNRAFGEYQNGKFHPWARRGYSTRKPATRKLKNADRIGVLASPSRQSYQVYNYTKKQVLAEFTHKSDAEKELQRIKKNPGELVILGAGNPTRKRKRRNPGSSDRAKDLFRTFHGREPEGVFEMQRSAKARKDYTILGPLVAIGTMAEKFDQVIRPGEDWDVEQWDALPHLAFMSTSDVNQAMKVLEDPKRYLKGVPLLASSPGGKQLYVISEEPLEIDVSRFDTDASKDFIDLGEATFVNYLAMKPNDPKEWIHTFGEEGGTRPVLVYDKLNKVPIFVGGSYRVEAPGIVN